MVYAKSDKATRLFPAWDTYIQIRHSALSIGKAGGPRLRATANQLLIRLVSAPGMQVYGLHAHNNVREAHKFNG